MVVTVALVVVIFCCSSNDSSTNSSCNGSTNNSGGDALCDNFSLKDSGILRCSIVETFVVVAAKTSSSTSWRLNFLLVARCSLLVTFCSLLVARYFCPLLVTRYFLLVACCSLLFARCFLFFNSLLDKKFWRIFFSKSKQKVLHINLYKKFNLWITWKLG